MALATLKAWFRLSRVHYTGTNPPQKFYRRLSATVLVLLALAAVTIGDHAFAQTPHSVSKTCNYVGGSSCPSSAVDITPWLYQTWHNSIVSPPYFALGEAVSWQVTWENGQQGVCPGSVSATAPAYTSTLYMSYGMPTEENYNTGGTITANFNPPGCADQLTQSISALANRTITCPAGYSVVYSTSPLIGPYCVSESEPVPIKLIGCPFCNPPASAGGANAGSGNLPKGDPVDASNGNLYESETDYSGVGNDPIKFTRSYNSWDTTCEPSTGQGVFLGGGWSSTYFQTLVPVTVTDSENTYNTVYAYRPDGRVLQFSEYDGVYSPDGDVGESLIQTSSGWEYQTADDTIEIYNSSGQLLTVAKRGQAPVTVNYATGAAAGDPPASVSDAFGHSLQFSYTINTNNNVLQLSSITDPAGHTISYTHDTTHDRLTVVTQADGTTRTYGYSSNYSTACDLTSITDENSVQYVTWTYNSSNQPATSANAGGVNSYSFSYSTSGSGGSVQVTDPLGEQRTNDVSLIWGAYRVTSSNHPCPNCGEDAARVYDASGNITSRTDYNGNVTKYVYNAQTNLETSRTEAYGTSQARTITTAWDTNWRQPDSITEPNRTTSFTYNSMGAVLTKTVTDTTVTPNVSRTWTYTYDSYGRVLTAQGARTDVNSTTTYTYYTCTTGSQCGQLETMTDPVGNVTTYNTYNAHGQPLTITDPNGVVTTLTYDYRLRLTSRQVGTETTSFSYYPTGLLKQVTLPGQQLRSVHLR